MANLAGFDATQVALHTPSTAYQPLPEGWYLMSIGHSEYKPTKSGDGQYLLLEWVVAEGQHAGQKVVERLNLKNANFNTMKIALGKLAKVCICCGVPRPQDSSQLHGIHVMVQIGCRKQDFWGTARIENVVVDYATRQQYAEMMAARGPSAQINTAPSAALPPTAPWAPQP